MCTLRIGTMIVFCETFVITSGPDIGKLFKLRKWQRKFIEAVYREIGRKADINVCVSGEVDFRFAFAVSRDAFS